VGLIRKEVSTGTSKVRSLPLHLATVKHLSRGLGIGGQQHTKLSSLIILLLEKVTSVSNVPTHSGNRCIYTCSLIFATFPPAPL
jgi:hypothetical protein